MSNKLNWAINIAFLVLIFAVLFNRWVDLIFGFAFILAYVAYFLVQLIRHRGGNEQNRFQWNLGPRWWRRFAGDDFAEPKKNANPPPHPPKS
jgi:hypothetical protein